MGGFEQWTEEALKALDQIIVERKENIWIYDVSGKLAPQPPTTSIYSRLLVFYSCPV